MERSQYLRFFDEIGIDTILKTTQSVLEVEKGLGRKPRT